MAYVLKPSIGASATLNSRYLEPSPYAADGGELIGKLPRKISVEHLRELRHRESSDTYHAEIFRAGRYRVILCKDAIQWIIQRRDRLAGTRWRGLSYCTCRDSLISVWREDMGLKVPPEMLALPETVRGRKDG